MTLPEHPVFGPAIGLRRNGAPIWPIRGASQDTSEPDPATPAPAAEPAAPAPVEQPLGEPGKKALDEERAARKTAEKNARELAAKVKAFEDAQKTDEERTAARIAELERDAAKALRYEAAEKAGIPLRMATRLNGSTVEELIADAEALKADLAAAAPAPPAPPTPKPDRRQGGGTADNAGSLAAGRAAYLAHKNRSR